MPYIYISLPWGVWVCVEDTLEVRCGAVRVLFGGQNEVKTLFW